MTTRSAMRANLGAMFVYLLLVHYLEQLKILTWYIVIYGHHPSPVYPASNIT